MFRFAIDRGGTFCDIYAEVPDEKRPWRVLKLLSVDPANYDDAPREGIRRILEEVTGVSIPKNRVDTSKIEWIRMGTTIATNALLERKGAPVALVTNKGFGDLLRIGNQSRPRIFDLTMKKPEVLYQHVIEIDERVHLVHARQADESHHEGQDVQQRVKGVTGDWVEILQKPDFESVKSQLAEAKSRGFESVAVVLMNSFAFPDHEWMVGEIAKQLGFRQISLSSAVVPMIKMVPRGLTSCADAYLSPLIAQYIETFMSGFDENIRSVPILFMKSDGGLSPVDSFQGFQAVLSGPAGGVVGYAMTAQRAYADGEFDPAHSPTILTDVHHHETNSSSIRQPVIGFDMGGTSTDVSRYDGLLHHTYDAEIAGVAIQAPQLDITTVAAGGGSRLFFSSGLFVVRDPFDWELRLCAHPASS